MTYWDIRGDSARDVLFRTQQAAEGFEAPREALVAGLAGAATQAPEISEALSGFAEASAPEVGFLWQRSQDAVAGAARAVNAYELGDEEMALNAQRSASTAPDPTGQMPGGGDRA